MYVRIRLSFSYGFCHMADSDSFYDTLNQVTRQGRKDFSKLYSLKFVYLGALILIETSASF